MKKIFLQISHIYNERKNKKGARIFAEFIMEKTKIRKTIKIAMAVVLAVAAGAGGVCFSQRTTLADYKNITLKKESTKATQKEMDDYILQMQEQYQKEVKREAKKGDIVLFSRSGTYKNKDVSALNTESIQSLLGKEQIKKGYDKQLIGMKAGDQKTFNYTYGKNDKTDGCAGKTVKISVKVKNVYELPKLTNSFVKKNLMYKSVDAYKKHVKSSIETQKKKEAKSYYQETAWKKIVNGSTVRKYPKETLNECKKQLDQYYKSSVKNQGMKWSTFIKNNFKTNKKYEQVLAVQAKKQAKERIIIKKIAAKEGIKYTEKQYNKRVKELATNYGYPSVKDFKKNNEKSTIEAYLMKQDVLKVVMKNVKYK